MEFHIFSLRKGLMPTPGPRLYHRLRSWDCEGGVRARGILEQRRVRTRGSKREC